MLNHVVLFGFCPCLARQIASGSSSYHPLVSSSTDQLEDGYSDVILGRVSSGPCGQCSCGQLGLSIDGTTCDPMC